MSTAVILKQIYHLPVREHIIIAERTPHSIRTEKTETEDAIALMADEYRNDKELTVFIELDYDINVKYTTRQKNRFS